MRQFARFQQPFDQQYATQVEKSDERSMKRKEAAITAKIQRAIQSSEPVFLLVRLRRTRWLDGGN